MLGSARVFSELESRTESRAAESGYAYIMALFLIVATIVSSQVDLAKSHHPPPAPA